MKGQTYHEEKECIGHSVHASHQQDLLYCPMVMQCFPVPLQPPIERLPCHGIGLDGRFHQICSDSADYCCDSCNIPQRGQLLLFLCTAHRIAAREGAICGHESPTATIGVIFGCLQRALEEHETRCEEDHAAHAERRSRGGGKASRECRSCRDGDDCKQTEVTWT